MAHIQGFQLCSHGIGDRANTVVLDIYESLLRNMTFSQGRDGYDDAEVRKTQGEVKWRVEHAQILVSHRPRAVPIPGASRDGGLTWDPCMQRLEDIERMGRLGIIASFQPTHGAHSFVDNVFQAQ